MKLEGIRVLDLSRFLPGPHLTMMMADHGAEVIKIEDTVSGDATRHIGPKKGGSTVYFRNANRGKRGFAVNLKSEEGREVFMRLAETADVIVETFRPGVVDRLGIGYDAVAARAPGIVYCGISAFGQDGPYRDRPAHDLSVGALAGTVALSLGADGTPNMPGLPPADMGGSLMALSGILMALLRRVETGRGDYLDMSMFDAIVSWTPHITGTVFAEGRAPVPSEQRTQGGSAFYRVFRTSDGRYVTLGGSEMKFVENLLTALERPDLIEVARRPPGPEQAPLHEFLETTFASRTQAEWDDWFQGRDVCFAPVQDLKAAFADPHLQARDMLLHDDDGNDHIGIPIKFRDEPGRIDPRAPALGGDTTAILREIGYAETEIADLQADNVVGGGSGAA